MLAGPDRITRLDLHLHSCRSDGRYSPDEVLRRAARSGLDLISLTDHDLAGGLAHGIHEVEGRRIRVLAGAEVSGTHLGCEYHLLVYFPHGIPEGFERFCQDQCQQRAERYQAALRSLDLPQLPEPDAEALRGDRAITRLHLAHALVAAGHARTPQEAFRNFLSNRHGHVPPLALPFVDAIQIARAFGGITSWAHPPVKAVRNHLATFVSAGLQGLEALRPYVKSGDRRLYRTMARRHGLVLTGGSDWHGWHSDDLGLFRVEVRELGDFVDLLMAA